MGVALLEGSHDENFGIHEKSGPYGSDTLRDVMSVWIVDQGSSVRVRTIPVVSEKACSP